MDCCSSVRGSEFHCPVCHITLTGLGLFDAHQDVDYRRRPAVVCRDPVSLGLVQGPRGTWGTAAGLAARERAALTLARARSSRVS